jgi:hypothetical protein
VSTARVAFGTMAFVLRRLSPVLVFLLAAALVPVGQANGPMTITVVSHVRVSIPHDTPPTGKENKGDYLKYQSLLLNTEPRFGKKKGVAVGWDKGTLTYLSATVARFTGAAHFPGQGSIQYRGVMRSLANGNSSIKIVGGGGKYTGAKGILIIGPGDETALNIFKFTLPSGSVA